MPNTHRPDTEATERSMMSSNPISPAAGSAAAIVGTPPAAQRSTGDGNAAPESFARALNQASGPPTPAAASEQRQASRSDAAAADTAAAERRAAAQRKAAAVAANAVGEKSVASGSGPGLPSAWAT